MFTNLLSNNKLIGFCSVVVLATSCEKYDQPFGTDQDVKRNELNADTALIIGTWNWTYTEHDFNWCAPPESFEVLTPGTEAVNFSIRFIQQGMVYFYRNESLISEHRLIFRDFATNSSYCGSGNGTKFFIFLDGLENKTFSACISNDTMRAGFNGFIFESEPGCESHLNYFIKQ
jgi:hypothetical protein